MNVAEMIAAVALVTQFIKKLFPNLQIKGVWAIVLAAIASVGVVGYNYMNQSIPFVFFPFLITTVEVFIGASAAYNLIKVARPKSDQ